MRYRCPICSFEFIGGGLCPSPYHVTTMMEELPEQEENSEVKTIEYKGNLERFSHQKNGQLVGVSDPIAKTIHPELLKHVGKEINVMSTKKQIVLTFIGESGIPFVDIIGYGGARLLKLKEQIGQWFPIDSPATEEQVEIELKAQEVKE